MEQKNNMNQKSPDNKESEIQLEIDKEKQSPQLKDMHLESGEKINDYDVNA